MAQRSAVRRMMPLIVVGGVVIALAAAVWFGQRSLMYPADRSAVPPAGELLPGAVDVTLTTSDDVALGAWYLEPAEPCTAAVLVAQGNGGNRAGRVELAQAIHERGFGVLLFDYRGYGGNQGSPSEQGLARDVRAARTYLLQDAGVAPDELIYLGESLGTGVVSELATEYPPTALVLRSPMTSFADVVRALYKVPVGWLLRDRYPVLANVEQLTGPIAVVYGSADTMVPAAQSRAVAQAARDAGTEVVEAEVVGAFHNDGGLAQGEVLMDALVEVARIGGVRGCG